MTVAPPQISTADEITLGRAALPYTLQLLGGQYAAPELQTALDLALKKRIVNSSRADMPYRIWIADHSEPRLDVLSGGQIVVSRGLLADLRSRESLNQVLDRAIAATAQSPFGGVATRALTRNAKAVLDGRQEPLSAASSPVKLAEAFVERGGYVSLPTFGSGGDLPATWDRLQETRPAYELLSRAQQLEASGERNTAIATYLQAAAAAPEEPRILAELGMAYLRADDRQSARIYLEKAVKLQPDYYRTRMGLGYLSLQAGRLNEASKQLLASIDLLPVTENLFLFAQVNEGLGRSADALAIYRNIIKEDSRSKLGRAASERIKELEKSR